MSVRPADGIEFDATVPVLVIGAGACGLTAALAARSAGAEVVVAERDPLPQGNTALSAGLIPAAGTRFQCAKGIDDDPARFAADLTAKAKNRADPALVQAVAQAAAPTVEWLADATGIPFEVLDDFVYPGHSTLRMHALPERTGEALMAHLMQAAGDAAVTLMTGATAVTLYADADGRVAGVDLARPDGAVDRVGCDALILAINGYGGNAEMVRAHIPDMADALYFGHEGNRGDAVLWGRALGAATRDMSGYQGHASVAHPHGILITWAVITEGGIQVNAEGQRFADESRGYSEQAVDVLAQPGGVAWTIFDGRIADVARQFEDFRKAEAAGAVKRAATLDGLAEATGLPPAALAETMRQVTTYVGGSVLEPLGRRFDPRSVLLPPYLAVKVTGALFHTQGGLAVDGRARVLRPDGTALPNLYAGGGAACGLSGPEAAGYLSGNGLVTAVVLGRLAGLDAARSTQARGVGDAA